MAYGDTHPSAVSKWAGPYAYVFRVKARDAEGRERNGWIRLETWGFFSNEGEVRWDEEGPPPT